MSDITYIPTRERWLYLGIFIDLYSSAVVGWSMDRRVTPSLVNDALSMAMWKRRPDAGLLAGNPLNKPVRKTVAKSGETFKTCKAMQ